LPPWRRLIWPSGIYGKCGRGAMVVASCAMTSLALLVLDRDGLGRNRFGHDGFGHNGLGRNEVGSAMRSALQRVRLRWVWSRRNSTINLCEQKEPIIFDVGCGTWLHNICSIDGKQHVKSSSWGQGECAATWQLD
jgi:hypothetical protein